MALVRIRLVVLPMIKARLPYYLFVVGGKMVAFSMGIDA